MKMLSKAGAQTSDCDPVSGAIAGKAFWFCVRTQPRREVFALSFLKQLESVESFFPRIQYRGTGRRRGQWITEAMFPGYVFCKFDLWQKARAVTYSPGIAGLIRFGNQCPVIPDRVIEELQSTVGDQEVLLVERSLKIGDRVLIEAGPMEGAEGIVCRVFPGRTRVALLLEFLGRQTQIEIDMDQVTEPPRSHPPIT
jgi:transcriptional antiterminator RfaH